MTNDITQCKTYQDESANVKAKPYCKPPTGYLRARQAGAARQNLPLNKEDCEVSIGKTLKNTSFHVINFFLGDLVCIF